VNADISAEIECAGLKDGWQGPDFCRSHAIARGVLDQVHGFVSQVEQFNFAVGIVRIGCNANAGGEVNVQSFGRKPGGFTDHLVEASGDDERVVLRCLRQHDHKLVSAVAKCEIDPAARRLHHLPYFGEKLRSDQVSMRVVHAFEMIEIDEHKRKLVAVALRAVDLRLENKIHVPRVIETSAIVGNRKLMNALDVPGVFQSDRRKIRQRFQQRQIALLKSVASDAIDQLDHTEAMIPVAHGHGHDRPRLHFRFFVDLREESCVLAYVGNNYGFIVLRNPAGDPLPHFDPHIFQRLRALPNRQLKIEFLLDLIEQQQRPCIGTQELVDFFHDGTQDLIELKRRREGLAELMEHRDFARFAMLSPTRCGAAPLYTAKILGCAHWMPWCLIHLAGHTPASGMYRGTTNYNQLCSCRAMSSSVDVPEKEASLGGGATGKGSRSIETTLTLPQRPPIFPVTGKLLKMTKGTFGDNLKREREMRGVSLDEISAATRIATRFLQAIENEQWDQLPGGVFNRGFVRAVAHYLGLDEENIVAEYALAVNDRPTVPVWTGSPPKVTPDRPWLAWGLAAVIVVAMVAGGWLGTRRILAWRAARRAARSAAMSVTPSPVTMPAPQPAEAPSPVPDNMAPATVAASDMPPDVPPAPVTASPATPASPTVSAFLELKVQAVKKTKLTIAADGNQVFDETMKAGENHVFEASDQFNVSAHDAGALQLELNGKTLAPIGPSGHAGKVTLTREALKGAAGGGN